MFLKVDELCSTKPSAEFHFFANASKVGDAWQCVSASDRKGKYVVYFCCACECAADYGAREMTPTATDVIDVIKHRIEAYDDLYKL